MRHEGMSQILTNKLAALRRKRAMVTTLVAGTAAVGAVVLLIALTLMLDWWLELPRAVRAGLLAIELVRSEAAAASGMSSTMLGALVRETEQMAEPIDFTRVVKLDRLATLGT